RSWGAKKVLARIIGRVIKDKLTGKQHATAGQALQGQMLHAALKAGVEIRLDAPVTQLVIEEGRVQGVIARIDGREQRIDARLGVLINAGGFGHNQEMLDKYLPGISSEWSNVIPEDTGDLILEGQRIGAAVAQMRERIGTQIVLPPGNPAFKPPMQNETSKPHSLVVDQTGVRYQNEAGSSVEFCRRMMAHNTQGKAVPSWLIFDSQFIDKYMLAGSMPGAKKPQEWFDKKYLRKADTLESLAADIGIDPSTLASTVARFNQFVANNRDEDFHRGEHAYEEWLGDPLHSPSKTLGSVEKGPFYAMQLYPGDVSTFGGLVTDSQARVLREDGSVIPGLYATGTSTASVMGGVEPGAGGSIGPAFTFGYIAARHACSQDT
ncbi:MAG TPA: FAD-binding protein, partial [Porticoccaceae bacterium]